MISFIFSIFVILLVFLFSGSLASVVFSVLTISVGGILSLFVKPQYRKSSFSLFCIVFSVYTLLALLHYLDYTHYGNYFVPDEYGSFMPWANYLGGLENYSEVCKVLTQEVSPNGYYFYKLPFRGYLFYIGSIEYLANHYLGGSNYLLMFQSSVIWGSITTFPIYRLMSLRNPRSKAYYYTLIFLLLTPICCYSHYFLRDIVIASVYAFVIYFATKKTTIIGIISILVSAFIIYFVRPANAYFIGIILIYYIYKANKNNMFLLSIGILLSLIIIGASIADTTKEIQQSIENYDNFSQESLKNQENTGAASFVWALPSPFSEILMTLNILIHPFPTVSFNDPMINVFRFITINLLPFVYSYIWFVVGFSLCMWTYQRKFKHIPSDYTILLWICILFEYMNTHNIAARRVMAVFPYFFFVYALMRERIVSKQEMIKTTKQALIIYSIIALFFIVRMII